MAKTDLSADKSSIIISEMMIRNKIYTIRGQKVMLDSDLAEIYGYETKAFNRQVKNNIEKFEGDDFMFRLSRDEIEHIMMSDLKESKGEHLSSHESVRCKNCTSRNTTLFSGNEGGARYLPYAFTEQGIYMLMTVLHGELATKQSRALIRMFKRMKDYILENQENLEYRSNLQLAAKEVGDLQSIEKLNSDIIRIDNQISDINAKLNNTVTKSEISPILLDFKNGIIQKEFVIVGGELLKATEVYTDLYASAKKSIYLIDNYISIKTLRHFCRVRDGVKVIIFSDNSGHYLHKDDYEDFKKEFPHISLRFVKTDGVIHDRFIILDYGEEDEKIYHCGASEKDVGRKLTAVSASDDILTKNVIHEVIEKLKGNRGLHL